MSRSEAPQGAQLISRAADILRAIPRGMPGGRRLRDIAASTGLTEPTVRRILMALIHEGLVVQEPQERRYLLGPLAWELGLASGYYSDVVALVHPHLQALAADTGMTAIMGARTGNESVSMSMADGDADIQGLMTKVGERLPLGVGVGGLSLLSALSDAEIDTLLNLPEYNYAVISQSEIRARVAKTRAQGFADISDRPIEGLRGIGMAVPSQKGAPRIYLSLVSTTTAMAAKDLGPILAILQMTTQRLGAALDLQ